MIKNKHLIFYFPITDYRVECLVPQELSFKKVLPGILTYIGKVKSEDILLVLYRNNTLIDQDIKIKNLGLLDLDIIYVY